MPATPRELLTDVGATARELTVRSARRGLSEQRTRVSRWRDRLWLIVQCSLTAALAWWLAVRVLGHTTPFFAPVAAVVTLGLSYGQRLSRALEVAVGVSVGIFVGEVFVHFFGQGVWQIALVCFFAMSIATWLGARNLMIIQAGLQSITVLLLFPGADQGFGRWLDGLAGCALALLVTAFAPASAVRRPRLLAAGVLGHVSATVRAGVDAVAQLDEEAAHEVQSRARAATRRLRTLEAASEEGLAVVRYSPLYRHRRQHQQALADLVGPLDRLIRDLRVLGRRVTTAAWRQEVVPAAELALLSDLADVVDFCAGELYARRLPTAAIPRLEALARSSSTINPGSDLSSAVILDQARFMIVDLLELCGLDHVDARALVPEMG